jgi:hypothetical protein
MSIPLPLLTALPAAPQRSDPANFAARADAFVAAQAGFRTEINSIVSKLNGGLTNAVILGTVSQVGGTPTGSIIERGSNDNGQYVRWADGTQICFRQADIALADTAVAWAATFATAAYRATVFALSANPFFTGYGLKNVGDFTPRAWNSSGTRVALSNAEMFAIGRWF